LPEGAGPMQYIKEFGETSALMLTVASPPAGEEQLAVLSAQIGNAIAPGAVHIAFCTLAPLDHSFLREAAELFSRQMRDQGVGGQVHLVDGNGFVLIRLKAEPGISERSIAKLWGALPQRADLHPDVSDPIVVAPGSRVRDALRSKAGAKY